MYVDVDIYVRLDDETFQFFFFLLRMDWAFTYTWHMMAPILYQAPGRYYS